MASPTQRPQGAPDPSAYGQAQQSSNTGDSSSVTGGHKFRAAGKADIGILGRFLNFLPSFTGIKKFFSGLVQGKKDFTAQPETRPRSDSVRTAAAAKHVLPQQQPTITSAVAASRADNTKTWGAMDAVRISPFRLSPDQAKDVLQQIFSSENVKYEGVGEKTDAIIDGNKYNVKQLIEASGTTIYQLKEQYQKEYDDRFYGRFPVDSGIGDKPKGEHGITNNMIRGFNNYLNVAFSQGYSRDTLRT